MLHNRIVTQKTPHHPLTYTYQMIFILLQPFCYLAQQGQFDVDPSPEPRAQVGGAGEDVTEPLVPHELPAPLLDQTLHLRGRESVTTQWACASFIQQSLTSATSDGCVRSCWSVISQSWQVKNRELSTWNKLWWERTDTNTGIVLELNRC